jgi:hypothetical protein
MAATASGEGLAEAVGLAEADLLAHEAVGGAVAVFLEALFHQRDQRAVLRSIDVGRHAGRIGAEPGAFIHCSVLQDAQARDCELSRSPTAPAIVFSLGRAPHAERYSIALPMSSTTFLASPNTIMVLSM